MKNLVRNYFENYDEDYSSFVSNKQKFNKNKPTWK